MRAVGAVWYQYDITKILNAVKREGRALRSAAVSGKGAGLVLCSLFYSFKSI
jgi:hypothetical protein